MRILLVNKFYYLRGGDCSVVLNTEQLLRDKGHEVAVFSMQKPENIPSQWEKYFPKEVSFSFSNISGIIPAITRLFNSREVVSKFRQLLADFQPDVVHLHNIHSYISPAVARMAHEKGIRVVWTLHDYKLICPSYSCLRNDKPCEVCFYKKINVVRFRCMKDSFVASMLAYIEARYWNLKKLSRLTDLFISPSRFLKTKMIEAGLTPAQIVELPNFIPQSIVASCKKENYYCYVGRLSEEKGVEVLLTAASQLPFHLKIIGEGLLLERYKKAYAKPQIEFCGFISPEELYPIVSKARFLVLPSVCYENNPLSVVEALCLGTPVLGARIGGIPELIEEGANGFLFQPGNSSDLTRKIEESFRYFTTDYPYKIISSDAQNKFGSATFYNKLINFYER